MQTRCRRIEAVPPDLPRVSGSVGVCAPRMSSRRPALVFIFITLFLDILGLGLVIPVLPKLVEELRGGDVASAAHVVGALGGLYALMQFLFSPVLGSLSDQWGRRPVILVSLLGSGLDYFLMAWAPTLPWFFIGRALSGLAGANITAATAYIADISPPEKRSANFGIIGAAFGLGFIAGPLLGGWLGESSLRLPFWVAGGVTLANGLYGFFVLPESLVDANRRPFRWRRANPLSALHGLSRRPIVRGLAISLFLLNLGNFGVHNTWVLYTTYRFAWTPSDVGLSLAVVGITAAVVQGGLARVIIPAIGERRALLWGMVLSAVTLALYGLATRGWMIYAILPFGAMSGICGQAAQGMISRTIAPDEQGSVQGAVAGLVSIAGFIAPLMATSLFGFFISNRAPVQIPGVAFFLGSGLVLGAAWMAMATVRRHPVQA